MFTVCKMKNTPCMCCGKTSSFEQHNKQFDNQCEYWKGPVLAFMRAFNYFLSEVFSSLLNQFMPSVPKNGTTTLTVNREIIQALIG